MSDTNRTLRIRTNVGTDSAPVVNVSLEQDYDTFEIMSLKLTQEDTYRLHNANYGVIVGRVLANGGFGVPNAKISVFIEGEFDENITDEMASIYPYRSTRDKDGSGIRYNLLPDNKTDDCHQIVGTFPNKSYLLDNDVLIEVFDKYYKFTTRTNNSGDYILCGVPTGSQTIHMDLDLSDCGILSQRPRDFVYKGYTIEQFENPNQFKTSENLDSLSQIFTQDKVVNVVPFWGNESLGETIGITRADIEISFKFEPTCVFMGCVVGDNASNGISKKCIPTNQMGAMDELVTGEGTIEMIRKTVGGDIEEFQVKGTQVIDGNGVWCYQIPMNLDYMRTDEYGNMVATDDPEKGIPTRARVRFRVSMQDLENNSDNYFRAKVLVPHNPQDYEGEDAGHEDYDYEFGSQTREDSFRDLFWNNVYTVKSYIPRFQKSQLAKTERFSGIKHCNIYGQNNPMPYNNIRIRLPFMFTLLCVLIKTYIRIIYIINSLWNVMVKFFAKIGSILLWINEIFNAIITPINLIIKFLKKLGLNVKEIKFKAGEQFLEALSGYRYVSLAEGLCPDLDNWYFAPVNHNLEGTTNGHYYNLLDQTFNALLNGGEDDSNNIDDPNSIDKQNVDQNEESVCLTIHTDYLVSCIEMNLAQEYKVINFDFYNDWVNGVIYMPRWMRIIKKKRKFLFGLIKVKAKTKACMDNSSIFGKTRRYTQQCALTYKMTNNKPYTQITTDAGCTSDKNTQKCHKKNGKKHYYIFGSGTKKQSGNGGAVHEHVMSDERLVYYFKPCEWRLSNNKKTILFANDIVLLGSLNDCNLYGIPQSFKYLTSSSYVMPTNLALTNMDDDGFLYADDGTVCSTNRNINLNEGDENATLKVQDNTFSATSAYYASSTEDLKYGSNDYDDGINYDDTMPITEAAGIAWNYTGPGQGKNSNSKKKLYYPGGHFLGISCTNSQTNIKSCVNLQRICEAGTTMSQRREEVKRVSGSDENPVMTYQYYVPTGLITEEDINAGDFRSMFATMNHNRLLCTNTYDKQTGYPIYDFIYLRANGFDGALATKVRNSSDYNSNPNDVKDEFGWLKTQGVKLGDDYDVNEAGQTTRRTIEVTNNDYYKFRLGLKNLSSIEQDKRFLFTNDGASLPQYENSYYFYFGLKDGATALDEFTKQFFSTCQSESIVMNEPYIKTQVEIDSCRLNGLLTFSTHFLVAPLTIRIIDRLKKEDEQTIIGPKVSNEAYFPNDDITKENLTLPFGTYEIIVTDANESEISKEVTIGKNAVQLYAESHPFEFRTKGLSESQIEGKAKETKSGYIQIGNTITIIGVNGKETINVDGNNAKIRIVTQEDTPKSKDWGVLSKERVDEYINIYLWKPDVVYDLYIQRRCEGGWSEEIYYKSFSVGGIDKYDLFLGSKYLSYSEKLCNLDPTVPWWNGITANTLDNWAKRHALFRQIDDDKEYYTNQIFALNDNNKRIDTALFGVPEKEGALKDGYYYEGDEDEFEGYFLEDDSIIPTWGEDAITYKRKEFGEMALIGNVVVSDKINQYEGTLSVSSNGIGTLQVIGSIPSNKIPDGYGCIIKYTNGEVVYGTRNGSTIIYYGADADGAGKVTFGLYPTFIYPVMYRPFFSEVNYIDWIVPDATIANGDDSFPSDSTFNGWKVEGKTFNGITYKNNGDSAPCFASGSNINGITKIEAALAGQNKLKFERKSGENDLSYKEDYKGLFVNYEMLYDINTIYSGDTDNLELVITSWTAGDAYSYEIIENMPIVTDEEKQLLNTPSKISLSVSEGVIDPNVLVSSIDYRLNGTMARWITNGGNNSLPSEYFLVKSPKCELKKIGKLWCAIDDVLYIAGYYNENAVKKSKKNQLNERVYVEFKDRVLGKDKAYYSIYESDDATEATLHEEKLPRRGDVPNRFTDKEIMSFYENQINFFKNLEEEGITIEDKYIFEDSDDIKAEDYLSAVARGLKLKLDGVDNIAGYINSKGDFLEDSYIIGITSAVTDTQKGIARIIRLYPNVKQLGIYEPEGELPYLRLIPEPSSQAVDKFPTCGGTMTLEVDSNVDWTLYFYYDKYCLDYPYDKWGFYIKEGKETQIEHTTFKTDGTYDKGTMITGKGHTTIDIVLHDNSGTDAPSGQTLDEISSVLTGTGMTILVSGISSTTVVDDTTNENVPLSAQTYIVLNGKIPTCVMQHQNAIGDTYSFGNGGGGGVGVNVISNVDEKWEFKLKEGTEWVKITSASVPFTNGATSLTGIGNAEIYLMADAREAGDESKTAKAELTPYMQGTEEGYGVLIWKINAGPEPPEPQVTLVVTQPNDFEWDDSGNTQTCSVINLSSNPWSVKLDSGSEHFDLTSGTSIIITAKGNNETENDFTGSFTVSNGVDSVTINFKQKHKGAQPEPPTPKEVTGYVNVIGGNSGIVSVHAPSSQGDGELKSGNLVDMYFDIPARTTSVMLPSSYLEPYYGQTDTPGIMESSMRIRALMSANNSLPNVVQYWVEYNWGSTRETSHNQMKVVFSNPTTMPLTVHLTVDYYIDAYHHQGGTNDTSGVFGVMQQTIEYTYLEEV